MKIKEKDLYEKHPLPGVRKVSHSDQFVTEQDAADLATMEEAIPSSPSVDHRRGPRISKPISPAYPTPAPTRMVEVAPNKFQQLDLQFEVPETVICDVVPIPGQPGTFRLVPRSWERLERVSSDLCRKLGLTDATKTLRKLIRSGFVDGARIAPKVYVLNVDSFFRHMQRCAENPDFWEDPKVRAEFDAAY